MKKTSFKAMLVTISLLGVVPVSVVSPLVNNSVIPFAKTSINDIIKVREVDGVTANDASKVLAEIVNLNPDLKIDDVKISNFEKATETGSGAATIVAKPDTNYTGTVGITINPLPKIELNTVIKITEVRGAIANDEASVLKEVKNLNPFLEVDKVDLKDFKAATELEKGSATVVAKEDTKYAGEVAITITPVPKIELTEVIKVREVSGQDANDEETVLKKVAELNPDLTIEDVEIGDFKEASSAAPGLAIVQAKENTKYTGQVSIVINTVPKIDLNTIVTVTEIDGKTANDALTVLEAIVKLNPGLDVSDIEIVYFNEAKDLTDGSAIIAATTNSNYTGEVGLKITRLGRSLLLNTGNDEQKVIDAITSILFTKSVSLNTKANDVVTSINAKYIKDRLNDDIANIFQDDLFQLVSVFSEDGKNLNDNDLTSAKTMNSVFFYKYGSSSDNFTKLVITVKQVTRTTERDALLNQIKVKADKDEDDSEWSDLWFNYFKTVEKDINLFSFQFPKQSLNQYEILKKIVYDEIKLVLEADLKFWTIEKGYDPNSVVVTYNTFEVDGDNNQFAAKGRVSIKIRVFGKFVKHSVLFNYKTSYTPVDFFEPFNY